jgi:hypothetical protein
MSNLTNFEIQGRKLDKPISSCPNFETFINKGEIVKCSIVFKEDITQQSFQV